MCYRQQSRADTSAKAKQERQLREEVITNARGIRVLDAIVAAVKLSDPSGKGTIRPRTKPSPALNPKLPKMMVQMLIHQRRPFHRSQRPEKEVRMLRASPRPTRCKAVNEFAQPLPLHHEVPFIPHH